MSELKPEVEYVIKTGRQVVEKKQVDFPEKLSKQLDAIKQLYNDLGAQVLFCLLFGILYNPTNSSSFLAFPSGFVQVITKFGK